MDAGRCSASRFSFVRWTHELDRSGLNPAPFPESGRLPIVKGGGLALKIYPSGVVPVVNRRALRGTMGSRARAASVDCLRRPVPIRRSSRKSRQECVLNRTRPAPTVYRLGPRSAC